MSKRSTTYMLLEERLGEPLKDHVLAARDRGESWSAIAFELHSRTRLGVTSETLRTWFYAELRERERAAG